MSFLFTVLPLSLALSSNGLALCPQAKSTSVSLLCAAICFNCTVVHDRANGGWVPVIKQSGDFKHFCSFLEQSLSLGNRQFKFWTTSFSAASMGTF